MRVSRLVVIVGVVGMLLGLLVAACGGGEKATPVPTRAPATSTPRPAATAAPTVTVSGETPRRGGILKWWIRTDRATNDPHLNRRGVTYTPAGLVFSHLVRHTMDNADAVTPDLAERWQLSSDGLTYTFFLKEGVRWHDGKPFSGDDVKYSMDKMADPERAGGDTRTFIAGYQSSTVVNNTTVEARLSRPRSSFLNGLTLGFMVIEPKHVADAGVKADSRAFLVGTGPFKYKGDVTGVSWEVERNDNYHHSGLPYLDGIQAFVVSDSEAQIAAVATKRVDIGTVAAAILTPEDMRKLRSRAPDVIILPYATAWTRTLYFNLRNQATGRPWADARVRQALFLALDLELIRQGTIGEFAGEASFQIPGSALGPSQEELARYLRKDLSRSERMAEARRLLAAGGYDGSEIRIIHPGYYDDGVRAGEIVSEQWRQVGVNARNVPLGNTEFPAAKERGEFDVYIDSWGKFLGTIEETVGAFLSEAGLNVSRYVNAELRGMVERLLAEQDVTRQKALARDIEALLWRELPAIPLFSEGEAAAWWPWVKGYTHTRVDYPAHDLFDAVWLGERF